jgi:hypothetical protein
MHDSPGKTMRPYQGPSDRPAAKPGSDSGPSKATEPRYQDRMQRPEATRDRSPALDALLRRRAG